ncbi:hypothetical protein D3C75_1119940 [compost metagenome]
MHRNRCIEAEIIIGIAELAVLVDAPAPERTVLLLHNDMAPAVLKGSNLGSEQGKGSTGRYGFFADRSGIDVALRS